MLADSELGEAIRKGLSELERGETVSHEDLWDELGD